MSGSGRVMLEGVSKPLKRRDLVVLWAALAGLLAMAAMLIVAGRFFGGDKPLHAGLVVGLFALVPSVLLVCHYLARRSAPRVSPIPRGPSPRTRASDDPGSSRCPYCRESCRGSSVEVDCPQCHARIHPECWVESNATCPSCRYSEPAPEARELA